MDTAACFYWCSLHLVCCTQKPQKAEINLNAPYLLVTCAPIPLCLYLCSLWHREWGWAQNTGPWGIAIFKRILCRRNAGCWQVMPANFDALISVVWINISSNIVFPELAELLIIWYVAVHLYLRANWDTETTNMQLLTSNTGHWVSVTQLGYHFLCLKENIFHMSKI